MTNNTLDLGPVEGATAQVAVRATARLIANFAWQHLKAATIFRDRLIALESEHSAEPFGDFFEEVRAYASACIMSSAASLETLINELFIAHNGKLREQIEDFESQFWNRIERKPILEKYKLALEMLNAPPLDLHTSPYQDAWALIELRNAIVHYKPTWDPARQRKVELVEILQGRFGLSPWIGDSGDFVSQKCMSAGCAQWAVATTLSFIQEFDSRVNLDPQKMASFKKLLA